MIGDDVPREVEPEAAHLREHGAFAADVVLEDNVEDADAVGGDHDEILAEVVDLADFSFFYGAELLHRLHHS